MMKPNPVCRPVECLILLLLLGFTVSIARAENEWITDPVTGHSYKMTGSGWWYEAEEMAQAEGCHLVAINDERENEFLITHFGSRDISQVREFWIGLTDADSEGDWEWTNGDPVTYLNWEKPYDNEPNGGTTENYASWFTVFAYEGKSTGQWLDNTPYVYIPGIMERDNGPSEIEVATPDGGEFWRRSGIYKIAWGTGGLGGQVRITVLKNDAYYKTIVNPTANDGSHYWAIPSNFLLGSNYKIRVTHLGTENYDISANPFAIAAAGNGIKVISPNGGETWYKGWTYRINWNKGGLSGPFRITLLDGNAYFYTIVRPTTNNGSYQWKIPNSFPTGSEYKIRVTHENTGKYDVSDYSITIKRYGATVAEDMAPKSSELRVLYPNGGEALTRGETQTILWNPGTGTKEVCIDLYKKGELCGSLNGGKPVPNTGSWTGRIDAPDPGEDYEIVIWSANDVATEDRSDGKFMIQ